MAKVSLKDIADVTAGNVAPKASEFTETGKPFVRAGSLSGLVGGGDINQLEKLDDKAAKRLKMRLFPTGTVLFAKSGMSCLKGYVYTLPMDCYVVSHLACVMPKQGYSEYLQHYLRYNKPNQLIENLSFPSIKLSKISQIEIDLPDHETAKAVVGNLAFVESQIELTKTVIAKLDELVKSRFIETFLDGKWPIKELHELADIQGGLTKNKKRAQYDLQLPYLRVANVLQGKLDLSEMLEVGLTEQERGKTLLANGDLLFVEGNGSKDQIGRCAIWDSSIDPCVHQNHLIRARFNSEMLPVYALAFFRSPEGRKQIVQRAVSTSGLFTLSTRKIKSLEIPVAPIELQHEFAAFVQQVDKLEFVPNRGRAYPSGFSEVSSHSSSYFPEVARKPSSTSLPMTSGSVLMDGLSALPHKRDLNTGSPQLWVEDIFSSSIDSRRYLFGVLRPSVSFHVESTEYH